MSRRNLHARLEQLVTDMLDGGIRLEEAVRELETHYLRQMLGRYEGNQSRAADELGMHRNTLRNKMRRCGLL